MPSSVKESHSTSNAIPVRNLRKTKIRRRRANLEQRCQVRHLAKHHSHLSHLQVAQIVGCSQKGISKILANKYSTKDIDPDALPQDPRFLQKYGIPTDNQADNSNHLIPSRQVTAPIVDSGFDNVEMTYPLPPPPLPPPPPQLGSVGANMRQDTCRISHTDVEWLSAFFNGAGGLGLPDPVLEEMAAAGLKEYTVLLLMKKYAHKLELANYLASMLRVTPVERDIIADYIVERRVRVFGMKVEMLN